MVEIIDMNVNGNKPRKKEIEYRAFIMIGGKDLNTNKDQLDKLKKRTTKIVRLPSCRKIKDYDLFIVTDERDEDYYITGIWNDGVLNTKED